ncbi:MAG TPA: hypothetical protein VKA46_00865 [Gemmataceae bacterium]|nr:hypothetical protein [Gemmataceae bacterium]
MSAFNFQIESSAVNPPAPQGPPAALSAEAVDLLRQLLEVQREQLNYLRSTAAAHDSGARWRAFLNRWHEEFPDLSATCRKALPVLEQTYGKLVSELTEHLSSNGHDALDNDFALQEFLDRYGMRLGQLGTIINLVAPLAEAGAQGESS